MENEKQNQKDEEISLIDLFTVLLRYRKLIIGITLVPIVLAVAGFLFYPIYKNKDTEKPEYEVRTQFVIRQQARRYVTQNLENVINNAEIIYSSLRDAGMEKFYGVSLLDETVRSRALYLINEHLLKYSGSTVSTAPQPEGKLKIAAPNTRDIVTVEVSFRDYDMEVVGAFIPALFAHSNSVIESYIHNDIAAVVENFERLLALDDVPQAIQTIIARDLGEYVFLKNIIDGNGTVLVQIGDAVIMETETSILSFRRNFFKKSVIIAIGGFFIAVFIAFALNVIRNIKNDEETMKKIRDAWGNSGGK